MTAAELARALGGAIQVGGDFMCRCPTHPDKKPSLAITEKDGKLLWICRAGCDQDVLTQAIQPFLVKEHSKPNLGKFGNIVATYDYKDENGKLLFQVCRFEPKEFRQRRPDGIGGWVWNLRNTRRVPYRLTELVAPGQKRNGSPPRVYVCEGEKDADRLVSWGLTATTNPGGAGKWRKEYACHFTGFDVVILGHNDEPGRAHVSKVAESLAPVAAAVRIPQLDGLPDKGDISDWINAGGTQSDLEALVELTEPFLPPAAPQPSPANDDDWQLDDKKRRVANSQKNVRLALGNLGIALRHDVFANRSLISTPKLPERALDDPILERLWLTIDETFRFRPTIDFFSIVLRDTARRNQFHPVLDYLDSLEWDGKKRLDNWLFTYGNAPKGDDNYNRYVRTVGRMMLVAAVRRLRQPGCKFDEIMVFVSETQGTDKSTALSILALRPEWFTDSIDLGAKDKEAIEQQQGKWIVEIPEMRGRRKNDVDRIKAFLSRTVDRARLAYGRLLTEAPRQCVYFGSANDVKFLRDRSGNRRFWPIVNVSFDVDKLRQDVDQLWTEAVAAEKTGESIRLPHDLWPVAETAQTESLEEEPWADVIATALEGLQGKIRAADVWIILDIDIARRTSDADCRMGFAMRDLGWTRTQRRYGGKPEGSYIKGHGIEQISASRDFQTGQLRIAQGKQTWTIDRGKTLREPL
jgi:predicted P-loop ATPase